MENKEKVIVAMAAAQLLHEILDDLEGTPYYRTRLKNASKTFEKILTQECDKEISRLWNLDQKSMMLIQDGITDVIKELASMDPVKIVDLGRVIKSGELDFVVNE